jgi:hypothetical protein
MIPFIETIGSSPGANRPQVDVGAGARRWTGALLVVGSGCVLLAATFLPWTSLPAAYVDGGQGVRRYSGWDLITDCAHRSFPGACVVEDRSPSPEFIPDRVIAGDWALVAGSALIVIGVLIVPLRSRDRWSRVLIVSGWVVGLAALACGVVTIVEFIGQRNSASGPPIEIGAWVALVSPVVALVGLAVVQTVRAYERAARPANEPTAEVQRTGG